MIGKPRGKSKTYPVYVYDPALKRKVYVGSCPKVGSRSGDPLTDAKALEALKEREFQQHGGRGRVSGTWSAYAKRWLDVKHGPGTRRASAATKAHNDGALKPFLETYGPRRLSDLIPRDEALDWAHGHRWQARVVSAMFADAMDEGKILVNPFANRQMEQPRGRKDIEPITEEELEQLATIAFEHWGPGEYGPTCRAWILMAGWVGCRPGEMWALEAEDLDLPGGMVRFGRIKGFRQVEWVILPDEAKAALLQMGIPLRGPVFTTSTGKALSKGGSRYYWDPVRTAFTAKLPPRRRAELLNGRPNLDLYELRHFCASMLAARGATSRQIAQQLGNSPEVCEETYIHGYKNRINEELRALYGMNVRHLQSADGLHRGQQVK
jgi:integrase